MDEPTSKPGADVAGWRNALNYYGWGSMTAGVYADLSYKTFKEAAVATVRSIAMTDMPVGVLGWYGSHAQIVTGYSVTGISRTGSTNFKINGIYLTNPLMERHHLDYYVIVSASGQSGPDEVRFAPYYQPDSIYKDPIDGRVGKRVCGASS